MDVYVIYIDNNCFMVIDFLKKKGYALLDKFNNDYLFKYENV